jgi:hypothetical protein
LECQLVGTVPVEALRGNGETIHKQSEKEGGQINFFGDLLERGE